MVGPSRRGAASCAVLPGMRLAVVSPERAAAAEVRRHDPNVGGHDERAAEARMVGALPDQAAASAPMVGSLSPTGR